MKQYRLVLLLLSLVLVPCWATAGPRRFPLFPLPKSTAPHPAPVPKKASQQPPPQAQPPPDPPKSSQLGEPLPGWPPTPPVNPKPPLASAEAAQWRYQRYLHEQYSAGKSSGEVLDFERWKSSYFDPVIKGGRPGRPGGAAQVATRQLLATEEGYINSESKRLGDKVVDMYRPNSLGGTDYVEVDGILQNGLPRAAMREKLKAELRALGPDDTLLIVDKQSPSRRIVYRSGEHPEVLDMRAVGGE